MAAPSNDDPTNAILLTGTRGRITGTTTGANTDFAPEPYLSFDPSPSVWYRWVAPTTEKYVFTVESHHTADLFMETFRVSTAGSYTNVNTGQWYVTTKLESDPINNQSQAFTINALRPLEYWLRVTGYDEDTYGDFVLRWQKVEDGWSDWVTPAPQLVYAPVAPAVFGWRANGDPPTRATDHFPNAADWDELMSAVEADTTLQGYSSVRVGRGTYLGISTHGDPEFGTYEERLLSGATVPYVHLESWDVTGYPQWRPTMPDELAASPPPDNPEGDVVQWEVGDATLEPGGRIRATPSVGSTSWSQSPTRLGVNSGSFGGGDPGTYTAEGWNPSTQPVSISASLYLNPPSSPVYLQTMLTYPEGHEITRAQAQALTGPKIGDVSATITFSGSTAGPTLSTDLPLDQNMKLADNKLYVNVLYKNDDLTTRPAWPGGDPATVTQQGFIFYGNCTIWLMLQLPKYRTYTYFEYEGEEPETPTDEGPELGVLKMKIQEGSGPAVWLRMN